MPGKAAKYLNKYGRVLFVGEGLGGAWGTYYRKWAGAMSTHRTVSRHLPVRLSREDAQRDLDAWAKKHRLKQYED